MKWIRKPQPALGDSKTKEWFACLPVTIGIETRWLEKIEVEQRYTQITHYKVVDDYDPSYTQEWVNIKFIEEIKNFYS